MADEISQRDPNRVTSLLAKGSSGGDTIALLADDTTKRLLVAATTDIGVAEDTAHTTGDTGVMILGVRQDTQSDFGADGDYVPLSIDADGAVRVSGGGGGTQYAVDAALGATPTGNLMIAQRDDALSTLTPVEGDAVGLRVDANGALWVIPSGTTTVDNGGTFAVQVDGDALTALQLIDDAVYVDDADWTDSTSKHILVGGLYQSTPQTVTDGDVAPFQIDANGRLIVALSATDNAVLDSIVTNTAIATEGSAAISTGPQVMGRYDSTTPTAVDDGDAVALLTDSVGRLRIITNDLQTPNGDSVMDDTADAVKVISQANSGVDIGDVDVTSLANTALNGPGEPTIDSYSHVAINLTTAANQVLVSSAPNKQIWVYGYAFTCGDADGQTVSLQDEDDTAITGIMEFGQYGGISVPPSGNFAMPLFKLGTDKDLEIDITGGDVDGWLAYAIVSV